MATINSNSDSVYIDMSESLELYDKKIINGRKEQFLYALCALDSEGLPVPLSRIELWLNGLVTGDVPTIEPQSRNEYFLKAILTGDTTNSAAAALTASELAAWKQVVTDAAAKKISFATI